MLPGHVPSSPRFLPYFLLPAFLRTSLPCQEARELPTASASWGTCTSGECRSALPWVNRYPRSMPCPQPGLTPKGPSSSSIQFRFNSGASLLPPWRWEGGGSSERAVSQPSLQEVPSHALWRDLPRHSLNAFNAASWAPKAFTVPCCGAQWRPQSKLPTDIPASRYWPNTRSVRSRAAALPTCVPSSP